MIATLGAVFNYPRRISPIVSDLRAAAAAIAAGEVIVYPTETVYGLGADARSAAAVDRVFRIKDRARDKPLSVAVPDLETVAQIAQPTEQTRAFMDAFLPGAVTVVCRRDPALPNALTAGRDRVGIRLPDHALARTLLDETGPITATSANVSGAGSVRHPDQLPNEIRERAAQVIADGQTPGGGSTVVDVDQGEIHRAGIAVDAVRDWLATHHTDG